MMVKGLVILLAVLVNNIKLKKKKEIQYQIIPLEEPELIDRGALCGSPRENEELIWAEKRLAILGFSIKLEGIVKSYIKNYDKVIVYADPRSKNKIQFFIFKKPLPKRKPRSGLYEYQIGNFYFLDTWKNDLIKKFEKRIEHIQSIKIRG